MKLSAPPPPPPEPNDPQPPTTPDGAAPETTAPAPPEPAAPAGKPLSWPAWFAGADFTLAVLALVLAFLLASFAARNSDVWLHLAAGKRLLSGEYTPGADPFSYSAPDRPWVNHSLLYDAASYLLFNAAGGAGLVLVKAAEVALAFGLLLAIRRPGFPLWPWAAVAAVAAVASAPHLTLRPIIGSVLFLAVTLFLLFRMPHRPGSWRFPAAFGVLCWGWAMTDEWFFLGPLAVALVLVGELLQGPRPAGAEPDPLGPVPDVPTLAKALAIGVAACMLNPHHVRVWQLPFELGTGAKELFADGRFRVLVTGPLGELYRSNTGLGNNLNGLAYLVLFLGGALALGLGAARLRFAHVALWVGFFLLSLGTIQAVPFLAVVAVPVIAGQLNGLSAGATLKTWADPRSRLLLAGSAGGRVAVLAAAAVGCVLAWPGWLHPPATNPAFARRVAWAVEPEPTAVRAAEQFRAWRESGRLPPDARGLVASLDLANYLAWYAPAEKVYANGRYNHHRPELPTLVAARAGLSLIRVDDAADLKPLPQALREAGAEYVAVYAGPNESQDARLLVTGSLLRQWADEARWSPWYFDGRAGVSGWRENPAAEKGTFGAIRLDPVRLAFGPGAEPVPPGSARPPVPRGVWDAFLRPADPPPAGADEAHGWRVYAEVLAGYRLRQNAVNLTFHLLDRVAGGVGVAAAAAPVPRRDDGAHARAVPFLALRAARRAIAAAPDHPDGYMALETALQDELLPLSEAERWVGRVTALRQCLARFPDPEDYRPGAYTASPARVAGVLADLYCGWRQDRNFGPFPTGVPVGVPGFDPLYRFGAAQEVVADGKRVGRRPALDGTVPPQAKAPGGPFLLPLDLAREALQTAERYAAVEPSLSDESNRFREGIKGALKAVEAELGRASAGFEARRAGAKTKAEEVRLALQYNLAGEALRILTEKDLDLGQDAPFLLLCRVALELAVGRLEEAAADLEFLSTDPGTQQQLAALGLRGVFRQLTLQKLLLEGNYAEAGRALEDIEGEVLRADPLKSVRDKFDPKPFMEAKPPLPDWAPFAPRAGVLSPLPTDTVGGPLVAVAQALNVDTFRGLQGQLAARRARAVEFFTRRGVLHLIEGDVAEAEKRFRQTRLDPVTEWGLPPPPAPAAELYLRLIEDARKRAAAG